MLPVLILLRRQLLRCRHRCRLQRTMRPNESRVLRVEERRHRSRRWLLCRDTRRTRSTVRTRSSTHWAQRECNRRGLLPRPPPRRLLHPRRHLLQLQRNHSIYDSLLSFRWLIQYQLQWLLLRRPLHFLSRAGGWLSFCQILLPMRIRVLQLHRLQCCGQTCRPHTSRLQQTGHLKGLNDSKCRIRRVSLAVSDRTIRPFLSRSRAGNDSSSRILVLSNSSLRWLQFNCIHTDEYINACLKHNVLHMYNTRRLQDNSISSLPFLGFITSQFLLYFFYSTLLVSLEYRRFTGTSTK